jgi:transposase
MAKRWSRQGLGIDVGKKELHACIAGQTEQGGFKIIAQRKFANTPKGFAALKAWLESKRKDATIPLQIILEVTGVYHEGILYFLYRSGFKVSLELAKRTKRYLEAIGHKSKTDKLDGRGLAQMACERQLEPWAPLTVYILELRTFFRHRQALIKTKHQFLNQLHALNYSEVPAKEVIKSLQQMVNRLDRQLEKIEGKIMVLARKDSLFYDQVLQIVGSLKGIGMISLLGILAETNGFKNFTSVRQLVSYAGLDIVENQSGQRSGKTRISKQGNARIRHLLHMPALSMVRYKVEPFYSLYNRLLKRNGYIKMKGMVAIQRKLLILLYTLWKKKEAFVEGYTQMEKQEKGVAPI